jgi:hypothetical protein
LVFSGIFIPNSKKAEATGILTFDASTWGATLAGWAKQAGQWALENKQYLKEQAVKIAQKELLRRLTLAIVKWIDSGFKGNPAFITDTSKFLRDTADITIGDLLMGTDLDFLCDPFKIQIKLALGLQYRPFSDEIKCSFTGALGNVTDAMNNFTNGDFIGGGGWDSWLQITTIPQNNQMGAMMIAQSELDARLSGNKEVQLAEAGWGGGFLSWKDCKTVTKGNGDFGGPKRTVVTNNGATATTIDGITGASSTSAGGKRTDYYNAKGDLAGTVQENQECTIQTPGSTISNKLNWADSSDIRKAELANDVNAISSALMNQLVTKLTTEMSSLLKRSGGNSKSSTIRQDNLNYLYDLQSQLDEQNNSYNSSYNNSNSNSSANVNFNQTFVNQSDALNAIDSQLSTENQYQQAQNNVFRLLDATQKSFASSTCSAAVKNDVSTQIIANYTGIKDLIWNKSNIATESIITSNNITSLNTIRGQIQSITDAQTIQAIMDTTNSTSNGLHSVYMVADYSPSSNNNSYNQIKSWVVSKVNNNKSCVGNISALSEWGIQ